MSSRPIYIRTEENTVGSTAGTGCFASTPVTNMTDLRADHCWREILCSRVLFARVLDWYLAHLTICALLDSSVATAVESVAHSGASADTLVELRMVARVLTVALSRRMARNREVRLDAADRGAF